MRGAVDGSKSLEGVMFERRTRIRRQGSGHGCSSKVSRSRGRTVVALLGTAIARGSRGSALSGARVIQRTALHLSAGLNAEVGEMAGVFAVRADDFAPRARLSGKGSGRHLEALFLVIPNQILLMLDSVNNGM